MKTVRATLLIGLLVISFLIYAKIPVPVLYSLVTINTSHLDESKVDADNWYCWDKTNVTLMVFLKSSELQLERLETMLLNSLAWFWPYSNSELVIVMDHNQRYESYYKEKFTSAAKTILPKNFKCSLKFTNEKVQRTKFNWQKQLPKFWADNYTNSEYIGIVDADTLFVTPVMLSDLFVDKKPVIRGTYGCPSYPLATLWTQTVGELLGLEYIANFMDYFPVIIRRQDFSKIRKYMMEYNNLDYFDQVFRNVSTCYSEFTLIGNYLWHFEHDHYHWNLERSVRKCNQSASGDWRIAEYLQRRLPSVSNHWPKVEKWMKISKETVLLNGICYADRTMWRQCVNLNSPTIPPGTGIKNLTNIFYDQVNIFEWIFEGEQWYQRDPETALKSHRQRMVELAKCSYDWNSKTLSQLIENSNITTFPFYFNF